MSENPTSSKRAARRNEATADAGTLGMNLRSKSGDWITCDYSWTHVDSPFGRGKRDSSQEFPGVSMSGRSNIIEADGGIKGIGFVARRAVMLASSKTELDGLTLSLLRFFPGGVSLILSGRLDGEASLTALSAAQPMLRASACLTIHLSRFQGTGVWKRRHDRPPMFGPSTFLLAARPSRGRFTSGMPSHAQTDLRENV